MVVAHCTTGQAVVAAEAKNNRGSWSQQVSGCEDRPSCSVFCASGLTRYDSPGDVQYGTVPVRCK